MSTTLSPQVLSPTQSFITNWTVLCKPHSSRWRTVNRYTFTEKRLCDLDLSTYDLENLTGFWPKHRKYLCKLSFRSVHSFRCYWAHKISTVIAGWPWPLTQWPSQCHQCRYHVYLVVFNCDKFNGNAFIHSWERKVQNGLAHGTQTQTDGRTHTHTTLLLNASGTCRQRKQWVSSSSEARSIDDPLFII